MNLPWRQHFINVDINCPPETNLSFGVDFLEEKTLLQMGSLKIKNRFPEGSAMFYWGKGLYANQNGLTKYEDTLEPHSCPDIALRILCKFSSVVINLFLLLKKLSL
jgi:hypothetical protein